MKLLYNGRLYEENYHKSPTGYFNKDFNKKLGEYTLVFINTINEMLKHFDILLDEKEFALRDAAEKYNIPLPKEIYDIKVRFFNRNFYYFDDKTIYLPVAIQGKKELDHFDVESIAHELSHIVQVKTNTFKDEGTYDNLNGYDERPSGYKYYNDSNEINALLNGVLTSIRLDEDFKKHLKTLDFKDFFQELINRDSSLSNFEETKKYRSPDSIRKIEEVLHLAWKKNKAGDL